MGKLLAVLCHWIENRVEGLPAVPLHLRNRHGAAKRTGSPIWQISFYEGFLAFTSPRPVLLLSAHLVLSRPGWGVETLGSESRVAGV